MRRLVYLVSAQRDLASIQRYITRESRSLDIGLRFSGRLRRQCQKLAALPGWMGRERPELRPGIRSFAVRGYVIFFRYRDDRFEVMAILEGHRDVDAYFENFHFDDRA